MPTPRSNRAVLLVSFISLRSCTRRAATRAARHVPAAPPRHDARTATSGAMNNACFFLFLAELPLPACESGDSGGRAQGGRRVARGRRRQHAARRGVRGARPRVDLRTACGGTHGLLSRAASIFSVLGLRRERRAAGRAVPLFCCAVAFALTTGRAVAPLPRGALFRLQAGLWEWWCRGGWPEVGRARDHARSGDEPRLRIGVLRSFIFHFFFIVEKNTPRPLSMPLPLVQHQAASKCNPQQGEFGGGGYPPFEPTS